MKINTLDSWLKKRYGCKVYKLSLSAGCTCPNRDGKVSYGGCIFCSEGGSGDFASSFAPLEVQLEEAKKKVAAKFPEKIPDSKRKYIAYFQSFTNTYGDQDRLMKLFEKAASFDEIAAVSIGTRPDSITPAMLEFLGELNRKKDVWVELGLQTIHEKSAEFINRGYPLKTFEDTYKALKGAGLYVVVHLILGLPCESVEQMKESVRYLSCLNPHPDGVKLQLLHVLEGTALAEIYKKEPFKIFTLEEYTDLVIDCLRILPEETVIHRMTGDGPKKLLLAPLWSADKKKVINYMRRRVEEEL